MASHSHEPTFFLLKRRLPAAESLHLLGRIVRQYQNPTSDYIPREQTPSEVLTEETFARFLMGVQHDDSAHFKAQASRDDKLWGKIKGLLSLSSNLVEGGTTEVTSSRITTRRLKLEERYFKELKAVPQARKELLEMCPVGGKAYLIVGTMSIQTARFTTTGTRHQSTKAHGSLPVDKIAQAAGVPMFGSVGLTPEAGIQHSTSSGWTMDFSTKMAEDDDDAFEVFAISCKEVTRGWGGFGKDVIMNRKRPEYRGGQRFGPDEDESDEDEDEENAEILAAESLTLKEPPFDGLLGDTFLLNPLPST